MIQVVLSITTDQQQGWSTRSIMQTLINWPTKIKIFASGQLSKSGVHS